MTIFTDDSMYSDEDGLQWIKDSGDGGGYHDGDGCGSYSLEDGDQDGCGEHLDYFIFIGYSDGTGDCDDDFISLMVEFI